MARITPVFPDPIEEYTVDNQRQLIEALDTLKNQLNFGYQNDIKNEEDTKNWFLS
jgi:hypothetical protein